MNEIRIEGKHVNVEVSFPWDQYVLFAVEVTDKNGKILDRFEKQMGETVLRKYAGYLPFAKMFLSNILREMGGG